MKTFVKIFFGFILSITNNVLVGQDLPLFQIISLTSGVALDGETPQPFQFIGADSKILEVPRKGAVGVITCLGDIQWLKSGITKGKFQVADIPSILKKDRERRENLIMEGYGHRNDIYCSSCEENQFSSVRGDSIFITWDDRHKSDSYRIVLRTLFDDTLASYYTDKQWLIFSIKDFLTINRAILVQIRSDKDVSEDHILKSVLQSDLIPLERDLSTVSLVDPDAVLLTSAIYGIYSFSYDQRFHLYQWISSKKQPVNSFYQPYIELQKERYFKRFLNN
ncbi:MAG: hypothetical protein AB7O48_12290 [Cyclobacteriaceae bacterium]